MKNIIPAAALVMAMASSQGVAGELDGKTESVNNTSSRVRQQVHATIASNDLSMQEKWRSNTEKLAKNILPGKPIAYRENNFRWIVYELGSDKTSGVASYAWLYNENPGWTTKVGILFTIRLWK
jgi:hypothetical protein